VRQVRGERRLAAPRGAVEEDTTRWLHAKLFKFFRVVDWVQNHLLKVALRLFETANVVPLDVWNLDHRLTQRRWIALPHRGGEMILRHGHGVQDFGIDRFLVKVDEMVG